MASSTSALSLREVGLIFDTFAQLKEGEKLCFKGNEVSIESGSSALRTTSAWISYAVRSGWSRKITDLTGIVQKVRTFFDRVFIDQEVGDDEIFILARKIQTAISGLEVLQFTYSHSHQDKETQNRTVEEAISQLRNVSLKVTDHLTLIGQQMGTLKRENQELRLALGKTKEFPGMQIASLGMQLDSLAAENQDLRLELEKAKKTLQIEREAAGKQEELVRKFAGETEKRGEESGQEEEEDKTAIAQEDAWSEEYRQFCQASERDAKENVEIRERCKRGLAEFADFLQELQNSGSKSS